MQLFVYGTLRDGIGGAPVRWLRARMRGAAITSVPGRLVAIVTPDGCFPALVRGRPGDRVWGDVCALALRPGDLARLDRYEGREYRRDTVRVLLVSTGRRLTAQLYRWRAPVPSGARPIARGDFLAWLKASRRRSYAPRYGCAGGTFVRTDMTLGHS